MIRAQPMIELDDVEAGSRWFTAVLGVRWFTTDDFDGVVARATSLGTDVLDGPLLNENARQSEIWLRGPEGYTVVVAGPREPFTS